MWRFLGLFVVLFGVVVGCGGGGGGAGGDDAGIGGDGGGGDGDAMADAPSPTAVAPVFGGVGLVWADGTTQLGVKWAAATDDHTPPDQIAYQLYFGTSASAVIADADANATPQQVVTGATSATITGLTANTTRHVLAVAVDTDGNRSVLRNAVAASTAAVPTVLRQMPKDLSAMSLTISELGYDRFAVSGAGVGSLAVDDIVIVDNTFGRSLRRIVSLTPNGATTEMTTAKADLTEVFQAGEIRASALIVDEDTPVAAAAPGDISITQTGHISTRSKLPPGTLAKEAGMEELEDGVMLSYEMSFDPQFDVFVKFSESFLSKPERVKMTATGAFAINASAMYTTSGSVDYEAKKDLFSKTMRFVYTIGGVPVYQEVILTLVGEVNLEAETSFSASATFDAQKTVTIGFEWDASSGFQPITEDGFTQTTDFDIASGAKASATIKVYPVIKTRLYKLLSGSLEVVPQVSIDAEARFLPLPVELTKADVDFLVDAQVAAELSIFSKELWKKESDRYELLRLPIHSLPDVNAATPMPQATICHPSTFYVAIQDGANNKVLPANIGVRVDPPGPTVTFTSSGRTRGTIETMTPGTYTVEITAHGDGPLGMVGTRYSRFNVTFEDPGVACTMVPPPTGGHGLTCEPAVESGLTAQPYFSVNRWAEGTMPFPELRFPIHADATIAYLRWTVNHESGGWQISNFELGNGSSITPPYDAEFPAEFTTYFVNPPRELFIGRWVMGHVAMLDSQYPGGPYSVNAENVSYGARRESGATSYTPILYVNANQTGADSPSFDDDKTCVDQPSPFSTPSIEIVGVREPNDHDDTPHGAKDLWHGARAHGRIASDIDADFYEFDPSGPAEVTFDNPPLPMPPCAVTFEVASVASVAPTITVYRGQTGAESNTNVVVRGQGSVTFLPNPLEVYFAKVSAHPQGGSTGEYTVEIDSDCTAATQFPAITGPVVVTPSTVVRGNSFTIEVPVDTLTEYVYVRIVSSDGINIYADGTATINNGTASLTIQAPTWVAAGTHNIHIEVATVSGDMTFELLSHYVYDPSFSMTSYAVEQTNYLSAIYPPPSVRRETTVPLGQVMFQ